MARVDINFTAVSFDNVSGWTDELEIGLCGPLEDSPVTFEPGSHYKRIWVRHWAQPGETLRRGAFMVSPDFDPAVFKRPVWYGDR